MVVTIKHDADSERLESFINWVHDMGLGTHVSQGTTSTIVGILGDTSNLDLNLIRSISIVAEVHRISEPYKNANRKMHTEDSIFDISGVTVGEGSVKLIAGPCSVESIDQVLDIAKAVKASGASMLRGGAFKPRTSPYAFQGMGAEGIKLLLKARAVTGLPIVSEVMSISQLPLFEHVDLIQVGARNMQNFDLLRELGRLRKPVLLKRGLANTIEELLMSAEYIMAGGNEKVILCERGIRTFETATRGTLDLSAVPVLKSRSHLPVFVDPSHAAGVAWMVPALSKAAVAVGADGLIIEVHNNPELALSDGAQALTPDVFDNLATELRPLVEVLGKTW